MSPAGRTPVRPASPIAGVAGYEYGNARLRARRGQLLTGDALRELVGVGSPDRLLGALRATAYGPDVERALVHADPLRRIDTAVRLHLAASLRDLRRFYGGRPRTGIDLLLGRWDLRNLVAVVRSSARQAARPELESVIVPAGELGAAELGELASQPSLRSVIELMVAWDLPSRDTARRLLGAWPRYDASRDPVVLEEALVHAWAFAVDRSLASWKGGELETVLRSEVDQLNLVAALRHREDRRSGGRARPAADDDPHASIAGGTLTVSVLDTVRRSSSAADVTAALVDHPFPPEWGSALAVWERDQDLAALDTRLGRAIARHAIALFTHGDALGIDIPIAFVWAKECEARNVRLVGRAVAHRLEWGEVETELWP